MFVCVCVFEKCVCVCVCVFNLITYIHMLKKSELLLFILCVV